MPQVRSCKRATILAGRSKYEIETTMWTFFKACVAVAVLFGTSNAQTNASLLTAPCMAPQYQYASALSATTLSQSGGLYAHPIGLSVNTNIQPFNCMTNLYTPNLTSMQAIIPGFSITASQACSSASLGPGLQAGSCRWNPQTYLGMLYDRGIDLMRYNVPQTDAFQA